VAWSPGSAAASGLDPWPARLLFLLALLVIPGSQILLYPILWILMPLERPGEFPAAVNQPSGAPQPA
jgi:phage shock protein C